MYDLVSLAFAFDHPRAVSSQFRGSNFIRVNSTFVLATLLTRWTTGRLFLTLPISRRTPTATWVTSKKRSSLRNTFKSSRFPPFSFVLPYVTSFFMIVTPLTVVVDVYGEHDRIRHHHQNARRKSTAQSSSRQVSGYAQLFHSLVLTRFATASPIRLVIPCFTSKLILDDSSLSSSRTSTRCKARPSRHSIDATLEWRWSRSSKRSAFFLSISQRN